MCEKPPYRNRKLRVRNVVELGVVKVLVDRSAVGTAIGRALELAFEFRPRLDQPAVSQRNEENRIDPSVDHILTSCDKAKGAGIASQDRNGPLCVGRMGYD